MKQERRKKKCKLTDQINNLKLNRKSVWQHNQLSRRNFSFFFHLQNLVDRLSSFPSFHHTETIPNHRRALGFFQIGENTHSTVTLKISKKKSIHRKESSIPFLMFRLLLLAEHDGEMKWEIELKSVVVRLSKWRLRDNKSEKWASKKKLRLRIYVEAEIWLATTVIEWKCEMFSCFMRRDKKCRSTTQRHEQSWNVNLSITAYEHFVFSCEQIEMSICADFRGDALAAKLHVNSRARILQLSHVAQAKKNWIPSKSSEQCGNAPKKFSVQTCSKRFLVEIKMFKNWI